MLTIFSTPKPFVGHSNIIQRNAIKSWTLLHPDVEVILFGDEKGAAEVCREFGVRHEPDVRRNGSGAKYLNHIFETAQRTARHSITCYVNCDIILMPDFAAAVSAVSAKHQRFLMIGRRWDTPVTQECTFTKPTWQPELREYVREHGRLIGPYSIDYFVSTRGLYDNMPPLVIGRCWWDHWLVWKAQNVGAAVVDASDTVMAIHQNHDYSYHPQGFIGTLQGAEAAENFRLAGGKRHMRIIEDATHKLTSGGTRRRWSYPLMPWKRAAMSLGYSLWWTLLDFTRPVRQRLGLRQGFLRRWSRVPEKRPG